MSDLSCTTISWRGVILSGADDARFGVTSLAGWEGLPGGRRESTPRPSSHGYFTAPVWADERIVTVGGVCYSPDERDAVLAELNAAMTWTTGVEDLTIDHGGRSLTAGAVLTAYEPQITSNWSMGHFAWAIEWRCPDPLRYGPLTSTSTTFPDRQGGLRFPLYSDGDGNATNGRYYGDLGSAGTLGLTNDGTADSSVQFEVAGPVGASGFEIVGSGTRLVYEGAVPAGSVLVIDTATGTVVMDGDSDRTLSWAQFAPVPAGGSAEWSFIALGSRTDAVLTATFRPAFW